MRANERIEFARCAYPTRNGEAPLLAAYARRQAALVAMLLHAAQ
jgi:hypothetical protein